MQNSPVDCKDIQRNKEIRDLASRYIFEVVKYPAYFPDEWIVKEIRKNTKPSVVYAVAIMNGFIPITTIGGFKSFIADYSQKSTRNELRYTRNRSRA